MKKICQMIECNPTVKLTKNDFYPLIDIDKINIGYKIVSSNEIVEYIGQSCSKFQNGDTLMARITPCLENGKIAQCRIPSLGLGSTEFFVFRAKEGKADKDYVYYLFNTSYMRKLAANSMSGASGRQRADINFIKNRKWNFPSLPIQCKISNVLSQYDALIENNNKRIKLLEQMVENLYKEWFVRFRFPRHKTAEFENGIPKGWKVRRVRDCIKRLPFGKLYKPEDTLPSGKVIVIDQSRNAYVGYHNDVPSHVASTDSPIALFGDHSCKMKIMICPFSLSENVVPYVAKQGLLTVFLFYALHGIIETTEYKRHWSELISKKILVPNISIQELFAKKVVDNLKMVLMLSEQNQNLIKQRDLLLPRLMSGKLEV